MSKRDDGQRRPRRRCRERSWGVAKQDATRATTASVHFPFAFMSPSVSNTFRVELEYSFPSSLPVRM